MDVVLFTSSTCPNCVALKSRLADAGIAYVERNTDNQDDRLAMYQVGRCTVPTLVVEGRVIWDVDKWFDELRKALGEERK